METLKLYLYIFLVIVLMVAMSINPIWRLIRSVICSADQPFNKHEED